MSSLVFPAEEGDPGIIFYISDLKYGYIRLEGGEDNCLVLVENEWKMVRDFLLKYFPLDKETK